MPELQVSPVGSESELMEFISFPWQVYREDPYFRATDLPRSDEEPVL